MATVFVTGGSGFIAVHCLVQLMQAGHRVRTTLRNLAREEEVRAMVREGGARADDLSFVAADLGAGAGWRDAVTGCDFVLPARDGVLRVLRAARDAGVKRVVLTSAFGAIVCGPTPKSGPYVETDWSATDASVPLYQRSKTLSERAAWDFIAKQGPRDGGALELSVVNPVAVLGPVLGPDPSHSIGIVRQLLARRMSGCPKVYSPYVDVRDVASLHLQAMTHPAANGERFIAAAPGTWSIVEVARALKRRMGAAGARVPTREIPNWLVKLAALRNPTAKMVVPHLGVFRETTSEKARRVLGLTPRRSRTRSPPLARAWCGSGWRDVTHHTAVITGSQRVIPCHGHRFESKITDQAVLRIGYGVRICCILTVGPDLMNGGRYVHNAIPCCQ